MTSGPSSRPMKPYPLALLNHLTVPFRRSTCAPSGRHPLLAVRPGTPEPACRFCVTLCGGGRGLSRVQVTSKGVIYEALDRSGEGSSREGRGRFWRRGWCHARPSVGLLTEGLDVVRLLRRPPAEPIPASGRVPRTGS